MLVLLAPSLNTFFTYTLVVINHEQASCRACISFRGHPAPPLAAKLVKRSVPDATPAPPWPRCTGSAVAGAPLPEISLSRRLALMPAVAVRLAPRRLGRLPPLLLSHSLCLSAARHLRLCGHASSSGSGRRCTGLLCSALSSGQPRRRLLLRQLRRNCGVDRGALLWGQALQTGEDAGGRGECSHGETIMHGALQAPHWHGCPSRLLRHTLKWSGRQPDAVVLDWVVCGASLIQGLDSTAACSAARAASSSCRRWASRRWRSSCRRVQGGCRQGRLADREFCCVRVVCPSPALLAPCSWACPQTS